MIGQFHYQALIKLEEHCAASSLSENLVPGSPEQEQDQEYLEDQEALRHQAQLRGLPYDSCLLRENEVDATMDNIFAIAHGEGHKPIGIHQDKHLEEMCSPTKYPTGKFGLITERKTKLTVRKYFNQRLLYADGRFARDIEYLLTARYAVESKLPMMLVLNSDKLKGGYTEDRCSLQDLLETSTL